MDTFSAKELVEFLAERSIASEAIISTDPEVEDDAVKIGGQLEVQIGDTYMVLTNEKPNYILMGAYRQSYSDIINDVVETLSGRGLSE